MIAEYMCVCVCERERVRFQRAGAQLLELPRRELACLSRGNVNSCWLTLEVDPTDFAGAAHAIEVGYLVDAGDQHTLARLSAEQVDRLPEQARPPDVALRVANLVRRRVCPTYMESRDVSPNCHCRWSLSLVLFRQCYIAQLT
jgi:hypothetical protein